MTPLEASRVRYAASPRGPSHGHIGFACYPAAAAMIWWGETQLALSEVEREPTNRLDERRRTKAGGSTHPDTATLQRS